MKEDLNFLVIPLNPSILKKIILIVDCKCVFENFQFLLKSYSIISFGTCAYRYEYTLYVVDLALDFQLRRIDLIFRKGKFCGIRLCIAVRYSCVVSRKCIIKIFNKGVKLIKVRIQIQESENGFVVTQFDRLNVSKQNFQCFYHFKIESGAFICSDQENSLDNFHSTYANLAYIKNSVSSVIKRSLMKIQRHVSRMACLSFTNKICTKNRSDRTCGPNPIRPFGNSHLGPRNHTADKVQRFKENCKDANYCKISPFFFQTYVNQSDFFAIFKCCHNSWLSIFDWRNGNTQSVGGGK